MSNIDIVLGLFLGFGIVQGFLKGFIWGVTSLIAVFVALWGAIHFSAMVAPFISDIFSFSAKTEQVLAFIITFLIVLVLVGLAGKLLTKILESVSLGFLNRIVGAVFGMLKWSLIVGTALMYLNEGAMELIPKKTTEESLFYNPIMKTNTWIRTYIFQYKDSFSTESFLPKSLSES